ncbi:hypothetical protein FACS189461_1340 [Spirochaetia bacterium]|nr:hypothetical protein FACS189461_1340 [Spirochaetia bacterium]
MLEEPANSILLYLDSKAKDGFSGGIKMGFEDGRPASFVESMHPDMDVPEVKKDFDLAGNIRQACTGKFYGTLFLVYQAGKITHFYRNRTWQGRVLEGMLEGLAGNPKGKQRVTIVVKRP